MIFEFIPITQVFQRHSGNHNLITIVPVESQQLKNTEHLNITPQTTPFQCKPLVTLQDQPEFDHNLKLEDQPKASTKFSRFQDLEDSEESDRDEIEISFSQSENEDQEAPEQVEIIIVEEHQHDDQEDKEEKIELEVEKEVGDGNPNGSAMSSSLVNMNL